MIYNFIVNSREFQKNSNKQILLDDNSKISKEEFIKKNCNILPQPLL
ncbi:5910_t:CDS:2 [Gigaspora margarita]|uniref:5910_t:CDS:1 n=1 Tax=Gigaspora margarita TaxID=4874 RepID=A0ABN7UCE5_GIGMA|nr:5910_t:CDS:2 [Gigaspora margarita]